MSTPRCSILLVDDEPYILPPLAALLSDDFAVHTANGADAAVKVFAEHPVDIILTDQRMPGRTGVQLLEWVRVHHPRTVRLLMTAYADLDNAIGAINRGQVYFYLLKPTKTEDLLQVVRNAAEKYTLERNQERLIEQLDRMNRELERRVTDRTRELEDAKAHLEQQKRELETLALTDPLTGLYNRRAMEGLAQVELKRHARYDNPLTVGVIDIDFFKDVNTAYLLTGGDAVLQGVARLLSHSVRDVVDSVGRIGGEEFLVIARETNEEGARGLAERIRSAVADTPIDYQGHLIRVTVSGGFVVAAPGVAASWEMMIEEASAALAWAKQNGRNCCLVKRL